jgi:hypothetical protein
MELFLGLRCRGGRHRVGWVRVRIIVSAIDHAFEHHDLASEWGTHHDRR